MSRSNHVLFAFCKDPFNHCSSPSHLKFRHAFVIDTFNFPEGGTMKPPFSAKRQLWGLREQPVHLASCARERYAYDGESTWPVLRDPKLRNLCIYPGGHKVLERPCRVAANELNSSLTTAQTDVSVLGQTHYLYKGGCLLGNRQSPHVHQISLRL